MPFIISLTVACLLVCWGSIADNANHHRTAIQKLYSPTPVLTNAEYNVLSEMEKKVFWNKGGKIQ